MKRALDLLWRMALLVLVFGVLYAAAISLAAPPGVGQLLTPEEQQRSARILPLVSLLMAAVLIYLALRSRWNGWKLAWAISLIFYGIHTFMSQIETAAFPAVANRLPPGMLRGFLLADILFAVVFAVLCVWILRKTKPDDSTSVGNDRLLMPLGEWAWKLAVIAAFYVALYFTFGYFVAWRTPGLPEFYGGQDLGFLPGLGVTMRQTPWLPFFQVLRAMIWTALGCLGIRMHKGGKLETSIAVGFTFSTLMAAPLLLPNPIMGDIVARAHLVEVSSSNLIFGFLLSMLLLHRPKQD
jgi:hypothetical protein